MPNSAGKWRGLTLVLIALAFPALYYFGVWRYSINIPSWDDFGGVLNYINKPAADRFTVASLFGQKHNEHRPLLYRLVVELSTAMRGTIDFRDTAYVGNSFLIGIFFLLYRQINDEERNGAYLPIVSALVFMPASWINMMWGISAIPHIGVNFLALLCASTFFLGRSILWRGIAVLSGCLAAYTLGSGLFIFPSILLTVALGWLTRAAGDRERFKDGMLDVTWLLLPLMLIATAYFKDYAHPENSSGLAESLGHPVQSAAYYLSFLGSVAGGEYSAPWAGALLILWFGILAVMGGHRKCPALFSISIFLFISAFAATSMRSDLGVQQALVARYRFYSVFLLTSLLVMSTHLMPRLLYRKSLHRTIFAAVLLMWIDFGLTAVDRLPERREMLIVETARWLSQGEGLHYPKKYIRHGGKIFDSAIETGLYRPPLVVLERAEAYQPGFGSGPSPEER